MLDDPPSALTRGIWDTVAAATAAPAARTPAPIFRKFLLEEDGLLLLLSAISEAQ